MRQMCAPFGRRDHILMLANDTVFGSHTAYCKIKERTCLSFWWPKLSKDVAEYCMYCASCQQSRRKVATDRVSISPIPRAELPFQHITMDCIWPIDPPSSKGIITVSVSYIATCVGRTRTAEGVGREGSM